MTIGLDQYAWPDPPRVYYASARNEGGTEVGVAQITVVRAPPVITVEQYRVLVDVPANGVETRTLYLNRALAGGYSGPVFLQPQVTDFAASGAFTVTLSENPVFGDAVDVVFKAGSVPPGGVSGRATLSVLAWRGTEAGGVPLDPVYRLHWPAFRVYVTSPQ